MLTVFGRRHRHCDGVSRRDFLSAGTLALGGLTLSQLWQARALAGRGSSNKAVIMIYLAGGPSHIDTYDMKPDAPPEIRGEFGAIRTNLPGIEICELMPKQAQLADKLAILRGVATQGYHTGNEFFSGYAWENKPGDLNRPALGSVVSRLRGANQPGMPAYVSLLDPTQGLSTRSTMWEFSSFAGAAHAPFRGHIAERSQSQTLDDVQLSPEISTDRFADRQQLLDSFNQLQRGLDRNRAVEDLDGITAQAIELISSNKVRDAFDLDQEPDSIRQLYDASVSNHHVRMAARKFLQARRLVEAGVSVVTMSLPGWDTHTANFKLLKNHLPLLDHCLSALVADLYQRGLGDDVAVLVAGEMGRTPRINNIRPAEGPGRDHWPQAGIAVLAGGGLKTGQVVGASEQDGGAPQTAPIRPQHLLATLYRVLGIDPAQRLIDLNGRPQYLLDDRQVVRELF